MTKFHIDFVFERYSGCRCRNQVELTGEYTRIHREPPTVNGIVSCEGPTGLAVFDGECWRELNVDLMIRDSSNRQ